MEHDLSWKEMIFDIPEQVLSFKLNATAMTLPSLSNLLRWGIRRLGRCPICGKLNVTAAHVLSNCYVALHQGRYSWRHDNMLAAIATDLYGLVNHANISNYKPRTHERDSGSCSLMMMSLKHYSGKQTNYNCI